MQNNQKKEIESYQIKKNSEDEIDLTIIYYTFRKALRGVGSIFRKLMNLIHRRIILIASFVLTGIALSMVLFYITKPYYTSAMTLVLAEIRNQFVENQLDRLSVMIEEDNFEAIADDLSISVESAMQIKEMTFTNLDEDRVAEDSVLTGSPFEIQLSLYSNELFQTMEPALAVYLESNRYFSKQKSIRQREIEGMITKLREEIASIDSIKTAVSSPTGPVNGFVYGAPIDPTNLYRESVSMYQQQSELEAELDQLDNIHIVNSFTPRLKPTGPNLIKYLAISGSVSFLVGVIVAIYLENKKKKKRSY